MLTLESPRSAPPSGAELYQTFSSRLLGVPGASGPPERRRSADTASEKRISHELEQFLRPDRTERSLSVTSTPSTLRRPLSRQSESEESITMVDVTWKHRKQPAVRKRQRPRPRQWEETVAETISVVRTNALKSEKRTEVGKQVEMVRRRDAERQRERVRREEIARQLEMVEQQERKIKEELESQQKMLQQFSDVRRREIEQQRVEDVVRQQELVREQEEMRKREVTRMLEIQKQHEMAKQMAFQQAVEKVKQDLESQTQTGNEALEVQVAAQVEKVERKVESQVEASLISIDISSPVAPMKSELQKMVETPVTSVETVKLSTAEEKFHKLEKIGEQTLELPPFSVVESLEKTKPARFCVASSLVDDLSTISTFSSPVFMKAVAGRETLESPENVRAVLPPLEKLEDVHSVVSVAREVIQATEMVSPEDLRVVELVEESFSAKVRHSQSSEEEDVFYDASDVDARSLGADGE